MVSKVTELAVIKFVNKLDHSDSIPLLGGGGGGGGGGYWCIQISRSVSQGALKQLIIIHK